MSCGCKDDIKIDSVLRPAAQVTVEDFDGELVAYVEDTAALFAFNPTASLTWQCLDGEAPLGEIVADLAAVFDAPEATVADDVLTAVGGWWGNGLVDMLTPKGEWDRYVPAAALHPHDHDAHTHKPCKGCDEKAAQQADKAAG